MRARVVGTANELGASGSPRVLYRIAVTAEGGASSAVLRGYSDFRSFHRELTARARRRLPELPSRFDGLSGALRVAYRMDVLDTFLLAVSEAPELADSLAAFLDGPPPPAAGAVPAEDAPPLPTVAATDAPTDAPTAATASPTVAPSAAPSAATVALLSCTARSSTD